MLLLGSTLVSERSHALTFCVISVCNPGGTALCAASPVDSFADGSLVFEPMGATANVYGADALVTAGWISVPSAPAMRLSSLGASQIRSIDLPSSNCAVQTAYLSAPVQVEADGVALGAFQPGTSIDLVALLGVGVSSVRLEFDPPSEGYTFLPLRVGMSSFAISEDPLARQPGRVLVQAVPEPDTAALAMSGLAVLAGARRCARRPPWSRGDEWPLEWSAH